MPSEIRRPRRRSRTRFVFATAASATLAVLAVLLVGPSSAAAQTVRREIRASRIDTTPTIDGVLDDDAWKGEPMTLDDGWFSYNPMRGEPAREQTRVWIAYDDRALYFAFHSLDTQPERIRTTISRRDNAWNDDWVGISLDSSDAGQLAYHLFVNPNGIQMDALNSGSNGEDTAPDWVWQSGGRVVADGWTAEMRIPLENLRFRGGADVRMGIMFWRRLSREGLSWSWPELKPGLWVFESNANLLFDDLRPRRLLEMIPSATFSSNWSRTLPSAWDGSRSRGDFGASIKYGVTSSITLDATVNPDFSQVESDAFEVEVNQRFPVFLSEKRPFFMEGLGLFNLAGTGGDSSMRTAVHTRRIIDPSAGIKLTGSAGRHTFGVIGSPDASPAGETQRAFTIGRHVMNFGGGRYAGLLATNTAYRGEYNRVIGGDFALRHGTAFRWNGSILSSYSQNLQGVGSSGRAGQLSYNYNTRRFGVSGQVEHFDRGFRMDTAFLNRTGMTRGWQWGELNFYPTAPRYRWTQRISPFVWTMRAEDRNQGGSEAYYLPGIRFNFTRAGFLRFDAGRGHETFAGRKFDTGQLSANGNIQILRWLNVGGSVLSGPAIFYDPLAPYQGDRQTKTARIGLQPSARLNSNINYTYTSFTSRETGDRVYGVHIINLRNTFQFSPRLFARAVNQFDSSRHRLLHDVLLSYELSPGTVLHAGYGTLLERDDSLHYAGTARALFFKASYLTRF